jgi:polysaccharide deacetylase family protein (PEP-CTERM system associated)
MTNKLKGPVAISVDVEDGINIAMRDVFGKEMHPTDRVVSNTERILDLFERYDTKATFFTLGQIAEHYPNLVKKIHIKGHEIGVHGYDHHRFDKMNPELARSQLSRAKALLEDLTGEGVIGHRAPAFSINEQTKWALPLLAELGFRYDSSIMPCRATHYGWPGFPDNVTEIQFKDGKSILEIPMSTIKLGSRKIPCLGGSYFRLLPYRVSKYAIDKIGKRNTPVFYMHPYETDPERYPNYYFDELEKVSVVTRYKMKSMWFGRKNVLKKMEKMLLQYNTVTMAELLEKENIRAGINSKTL